MRETAVFDRPEKKLLLFCARTRLDAEMSASMKALLRQGIKWPEFLQMAQEHSVMPLVCSHLGNLEEELVPSGIRRVLQRYSQQITQHNFRLTRELLKILAIFKQENIAVVPFKGPVLTIAAYGNLALRSFSDLDILVHKHDVLRAKELLVSHNYYLQSTLTNLQEEAHLRDDHVYDLMRQDGKVHIELHWAITSSCIPFSLDLAQLEKNLQPLTWAGTTVPNNSPEDTLVILCVHGTKHVWERLGWICDVAELIKSNPDMDWERVMTLAKSSKSLRMVQLGLFLAHDILQAELPEHIRKKLKSERRTQQLAAHVQHKLFSESSQARFSDDLFIIRTIESVPDQMGYALHLATTPSVEERALLPDSFAFLWWLIRPIRLLSNTVRNL
jgi:hypothetical protein